MKIPNFFKILIASVIFFSYFVFLVIDIVLGGLWFYQNKKLNESKTEAQALQDSLNTLNTEVSTLQERKIALEEALQEIIDAEVLPYLDTITIMEKIRGISAENLIRVKVISQDELEAFLLNEFEKEYSDDEMAVDERCLKMLGLLDKGANLKQIILDAYGPNILGFYDTEDDMMYLIERGASSNSEQVTTAYYNYIFSHEYIHFLQDTTWNLDGVEESIEERYPDNSDALIAYTSLVEGEATTAEDEYVEYLSHEKKEAYDALLEYVTSQSTSEGYVELPNYMRETMLFPYTKGKSFVAEIIYSQGWEGVDTAYGDLPRSSEQILHPEKYLSKRDDPTVIKSVNNSSKIGSGWSYLDQDVMGELLTKIILDEANVSDPEIAAEGWGGDLVQFYQNSNGSLLCVWQSYWDSDSDADEFLDAFDEYAKYYSYSYEIKKASDGKIVAVFGGTLEARNSALSVF